MGAKKLEKEDGPLETEKSDNDRRPRLKRVPSRYLQSSDDEYNIPPKKSNSSGRKSLQFNPESDSSEEDSPPVSRRMNVENLQAKVDLIVAQRQVKKQKSSPKNPVFSIDNFTKLSRAKTPQSQQNAFKDAASSSKLFQMKKKIENAVVVSTSNCMAVSSLSSPVDGMYLNIKS